ncbi:unnamed protein product [Paramecium sonneborni]|uniref:Coatomer subunit epsilon n=1 Tax=Paramecium sonneborni TaxID=65129 RepID=A0A8S1MRL5_9CILI|nr:unnamed protein product [Paramecium sonneborni]
MEQQILLQTKIAFFLGNFNKVLEIWQQNDYEDDYYYFLVSRALIAARELKPKTIRLTKKPSSKLLEITDIVSRFMGPLIEQQRADTTIDEDRKQIEDVLKKLKDIIPQQNQKIIQIICAYMSVNSCEAQYALQLELPKDAFQQELLYLQFMIYLRGRRFDLAESTLLDLRRFDDEDILTYLAQIYLNLYNGQPEQAFKSIQETKDRFGDSSKLMNLMITCLIHQNKFEEAFESGQKVKTLIIDNEQFSDRQEIEVCLSNLIVLSELLNKQQQKEEYIQVLEQINKSCHFLKRYQEKVKKIDQLS